MSITEEIRRLARDMLESGQVTRVIGYEEGRRGQVRPLVAHTSEETDRLLFDERCVHNLALYLLDLKPKRGEEWPNAAVVLKPCDARALNILVLEHQVDREKIHVIGVHCPGMAKSACAVCTERVPPTYDTLLGEPPAELPASGELDALVQLEAMSPQERRDFWGAHFARCIRCYACRQVCPMCYCETCIAEKLDPPWESIAIAPPENEFYHVLRAYHLTGRCSSCGECERVCPMGIPVYLYNLYMSRQVAQTFDGFRAGLDAETLAPFMTFRKDELED